MVFTKRQMDQILEEISTTRTIIIITHYMKQLDYMDKIIVLEKGHLVQQGTPEELKQENGTYRKMIEL